MKRQRALRARQIPHVGILLAGLAALSAASSEVAQVAPVAAPVTVLDRNVAKGQVLADGDFTVGRVNSAQARGALRAIDAVGMEAARNLPPGSVVRSIDLLRPQIVRRGEQVLIVMRSQAILITSSGRALGSAAAGEPVRVVATATNRTLDAIADAPGAVHVPF